MKPRTHFQRLLAAAAELRASGLSWDSVATRVGRRPAVCRAWPRRYRAYWQEFYQQAEARQRSEAAAEAILALRELLRSQHETIRRDAARALLGPRAAKPADEAAPPAPDAFAAALEGLDREQIQSLAEGLDALEGVPGPPGEPPAAP